MKWMWKIGSIVLIAVGVGFLVALDIADRGIYYSKHIPEKEKKEFHLFETIEEIQQAYEKNYANPAYTFPRGQVEKVKLYRNTFLISRITSKTLSPEKANAILEFLNTPDNFDWGETTWSLDESEYILRFFDHQDNEIGKVWVCMENCGMTESIPFSPSMKFGGLSKVGREKLNRLLHQIHKD